jgi:hypothetical protein
VLAREPFLERLDQAERHPTHRAESLPAARPGEGPEA